jgi:folate-binding protein YgfZ
MEAQTGEFAGRSIVLNYGEVGGEYAAMKKAAGLFDANHRGILQITGSDRHKFLGNLLSNDTQLSPGQVRGAFLLNGKGRVAMEMTLIEASADSTLIETSIHHVPLLAKLLDRYLFAEKVKLIDRSNELATLWLVGPGAATLASTAFGGEVLTQPMSCQSTGDITTWRDDFADLIVVGVILPRAKLVQTWNGLLEKHGQELSIGRRALRAVGWNAFNAVRIESGRPIAGIDFELAPPDMPGKKKDATEPEASLPTSAFLLPAETGVLCDRNVSFVKGCYLGQEVVARMYSRGQLARKLVRVWMKGEELPLAGGQVFDSTQSNQIGANPIGIVTSSSPSPASSNRAVLIALVKKGHFDHGSVLKIPAEGAVHEGVVE